MVSERLGALTGAERSLEEAGADVVSLPLWDLSQIRQNAGDADVLIIGAVEPFDRAALEALPGRKALVHRGVGFDNVDTVAATELGIPVGIVPDASVEEVSDHALALLLASERRLLEVDHAVREGLWRRDSSAIQARRQGARRLSTLTLGVVGFGRIGRALARKAAPVYARVVTCDPVAEPAACAAAGVELLTFDDLLDAADHISVHVPLTAETHHLFDLGTLRRLRPGAVLVNTSRGGIVDEAALIDVLATGPLAMAGLDVTESEPLPEGDPLTGAPRLILTAHSGSWSQSATTELRARSVQAARAALDGRLPPALANPEVAASPRLRVTMPDATHP